MAIGKEFLELESIINYKFSDISYLECALTHSSYSYEQKSRGRRLPSNERLEFLGDAVLEIVISEHLYSNYKNQSEGALTKMRQHLVCEKTLASVARGIGLGEYFNLGNGEEGSDCRNRPKVLADALEALFAAIYLDSKKALDGVTRVILSLLKSEIENSVGRQRGDYKTLLQQLIEKDGAAVLEYEVVAEEGPEHDKIFTVAAKVNNNVVGKASGNNKKEAEMGAAKIALELFGVKI
jgi:ribonuclease-3